MSPPHPLQKKNKKQNKTKKKHTADMLKTNKQNTEKKNINNKYLNI